MSAFIPPIVDEPHGAARIKQDPESFLGECRDRHGSIFTVIVDGGTRMTYVLDPHVFRPLLTAREVSFCAISRQSKLRFGLGKVVETDEDVRSLSTDLIRALRGRALDAAMQRFTQRMASAVAHHATTLGSDQIVPVQTLVHRTLMPATVYALFGEDIYDETFVDDFLAFSASVSTRFAGSDPTLHTRGHHAQNALLQRLERVLDRPQNSVMEALQNGALGRPDLSRDEQLRTLLMLMWGSMVNLIPTSIWMYSTVIRDPKLVCSLRTGDDAAVDELAFSIVQETLRLFSRPNMYRQVIENFELPLANGTRVRFLAGDWIALFPRFLHHDPEVFRDALQFDARRFCPVDGHEPTFSKGQQSLQDPTVVFGLGRGRCPGDVYSLRVLAASLRSWMTAFNAEPTNQLIPKAIRETVASTPGPEGLVYVRIT